MCAFPVLQSIEDAKRIKSKTANGGMGKKCMKTQKLVVSVYVDESRVLKKKFGMRMLLGGRKHYCFLTSNSSTFFRKQGVDMLTSYLRSTIK